MKRPSINELTLEEKIGQLLMVAQYPLLVKVVDGVETPRAEEEIKEKARTKAAQRYKDILEVTGARLVPEWLEADHDNLKGTVKQVPTREMIDVPVNEMLIVELYSK